MMAAFCDMTTPTELALSGGHLGRAGDETSFNTNDNALFIQSNEVRIASQSL
jgi:hypothetical protein